MKKIQLASNGSNNHLMIGICTAMKDYRLTWFLNKELSINLVKQKDVNVFIEKKNKKGSFSFYYYDQTENLNTYYFISNRNEDNEIIFSDHKQINYFLLIKGQAKKIKFDELISTIKEIVNIQMAFLIESFEIKTLSGLLEDIEIHLLNIQKGSSKNSKLQATKHKFQR